MIISIMFANEKNLSCLEGLIVQEKRLTSSVRYSKYFVRGFFRGTFYLVLFSVNLYQPVFQAFLGFLVMATAIVETPIYFVVISCLLNIIMCGVSLVSILISSKISIL